MTISQSAHILELARELVDDVELSRLGPEQLLLKATRLARLTQDEAAAEWLRFELHGYTNDARSRGWMLYFGRVKSSSDQLGYFQPLAGVSGAMVAIQTQIQQLKLPDIQFAPSSANPNELVTGFAGSTAARVTKPIDDILQRLQSHTTALTQLSSIRSRVLNAIHDFATRVYYERALGGLAESIFERHKTSLDSILGKAAPDVLAKIPAIYDRLAAGDSEAISQALNSVRRMIKTFADAVYPPSEVAVLVEGQSYVVGNDKVLNRIKVFLTTRCASTSRSDRLTRNLRSIHERASAGSHADVTADEAQSLFLQAYLTLGEILVAATPTESATGTASPN